MFCSNCGKEIADGAKFCPECGKAVGSESGNAQGSDGKEKVAGAALSVKDKIKNAVGSTFSTIVALAIGLGVALLVALPVAALIGVIPTAILAIALICFAIARYLGETHYVRLAVLALIVIAQIGFLYMANHSAKSVQVIKSAEIAGMTWESVVENTLAKPKWSVEKFPSDGTRFVKVTGYLLDTQTGKKRKTKLHFSVKDVWNVAGGTEMSLDSVYIKGYGEGTDAMRAFNQLIYSVR